MKTNFIKEQKNSINEQKISFTLPEGCWQGYIWMSKADKPEVFFGLEEQEKRDLKDGENPFVVEAQLVINKQSYSIKYIDGQYYIYQYAINDFYDESANKPVGGIVADILSYAPNKMPDNVSGLKFLRIWREEKTDEFSTLVPAEMVFLGLNLKK